MSKPGVATARGWVRLCSTIVLGMLCAAAMLIALDPASRAGATALPPAVTPLRAPAAPQSVTAVDDALQAAGLVTATHTAVSATAPIHYGIITALPAGTSTRGSGLSSGPDAGDPGRLAPQSGGVKYDNLSTLTNAYVPGSPAAATGAYSSSLLVADNITLSEAVDGLRVTQFVVAIHNLNVGTVSAEINFDFWYDDGPSGGPGTYFKNASGAIVGYYYPSYALAHGLNLLSVNVPDAAFTFPAGRKTFWAGVVVDNQGLPSTTAAQLNQIGQQLYDPPMVGSSTDTLFKSSTAGNLFAVNNPSGSQSNFGGTPVANLGWRFTFDNICPTVVTTTVDNVAGSLRSALACATPGDTITFTLPANSLITLTSGELTVTEAITIDGSTAVNLAVSGNNASRVFSITAPVNVISLTVMNGNAGAGQGGGIYSTSALTLTNVAVLSSTAGSEGGGAYAGDAAMLNGGLFQNDQASVGGGLFANSTLVLTGTQFLSNTAPESGGLWANSTLVLTNANFISNTATVNEGGGATMFGAATISGGLFQNNASTNGQGGGLFAQSTLALTGTQFVNNTAAQQGGGLYAYSTLALWETSFLSNTTHVHGGGAYANVAATLSNGRFQDNHADDSGGGLFAGDTLALTGTKFISNTASSNGGGAWMTGAATLSGGLFLYNQSLASSGGGLYAGDALAITATQFFANAANTGGGAIYQAGSGDGRVVNTLFAGNVDAGSFGAAMGLASSGAVQVLHATIASPTLANGPAIYVGSGTVGITDTLIASYTVGIRNDGGIVYQDYNLFFATPITTSGSLISGGTHNRTGDPHFANASAGNYHLLFPSAAIDTGANSGVTTDFDGDARPQNGFFDIGYDEFTGALLRLFLPAIMR